MCTRWRLSFRNGAEEAERMSCRRGSEAACWLSSPQLQTRTDPNRAP